MRVLKEVMTFNQNVVKPMCEPALGGLK